MSGDCFSIETFIDSKLTLNESNINYSKAINEFNNIQNLLLSKSASPITRVYLSGSLGKQTALNYHFDIDIVVFYRASNYDEFMKKRKSYLQEMQNLFTRRFEFDKFGKFSFKLTSRNGFKIDILTAADFGTPNPMNHCSQLIHSLPKQRSRDVAFQLHTSSCEYTVNFVTRQSQFVKRLIILCKHWGRTILQNYVTAKGRSSLIELIAIHVGQSVEKRYKRSNDLIDAFKIFLENCADFHNLAIEFDEPPLKHIYKVNAFERPFVIEPSNPYNNRVVSLNSEERKIFSEKAESTLHSFKTCLQEDGRSNVLVEFLDKMKTPPTAKFTGHQNSEKRFADESQSQDNSEKSEGENDSILLGIGAVAAGLAALGGIGYLLYDQFKEKKDEKEKK